MTRPWAYPETLRYAVSSTHAKTRKLADGRIEGLAARYHKGHLMGQVSVIADDYNTARRTAERALGIRRTK